MISVGCHLFKAPLPLEGLAFRGVEPGCSGEVGSSPQEPALRILLWALLGLAAGAQPGATSWLDTELVFPPSPGAWGEVAGAGRSESSVGVEWRMINKGPGVLSFSGTSGLEVPLEMTGSCPHYS